MRHAAFGRGGVFSAGFAIVLFAGGSALAADPNGLFGGRNEKPDGSAAVTVGRELPLDWETKVGVDVRTAADEPGGRPWQRSTPDGGNGSVWGSIAVPVPDSPYAWDKQTVEARVDPASDQGKLGTTLSRSVPLGGDMSMTVQNSFSVIRQLPNGLPDSVTLGTIAAPPSWGTEPSVRLRVAPTDTTFAIGSATTNNDPLWHNKLSAEQKLFGPVTITGAVSDPGTPISDKSLTAGFKTRW